MTAMEWGVTYVTEQGDLHTEWGHDRSPVDRIDKDGEILIGKRDWVKVYEVLSRPIVMESSVWQSDECPWRNDA
jgi:hypothetical protein